MNLLMMTELRNLPPAMWVKAPHVFLLKKGAHLVAKDHIDDIPHKMKDADFFILYEIEKEETELASKIDISKLLHPAEGYTIRQTYTTNLEEILIEDEK